MILIQTQQIMIMFKYQINDTKLRYQINDINHNVVQHHTIIIISFTIWNI